MHRIICLIAILFVWCLVSANGQETPAMVTTSSLYGRLATSNPRVPVPQSWTVQVTAKPIAGNKMLDVVESQGEMYCVKVPLSSKVFLIFQCDGYDHQRTDVIDTAHKKHSFALQIVKLDLIRVAQGVSSVRETQRRQEIRAKLNKHKEALSATSSNDIFMWNLQLYRNLFKGEPEILAEIDRFETELKKQPEFLFLSTSEYEQKSKLFKFIISQIEDHRIERNVKTADLAALVIDLRVFSGIRFNAISVLSSLTDLSSNERAQAAVALTKALERDSSATIRSHAATALAQLGNRDVLDVLRRVSKEDESPEVQTAANAAAGRIISKFPEN